MNITYEDKIDLDKEIFDSKNPFAIFRGCYVFFHSTPEVNRYSFGCDEETSSEKLI